MAEDLRYTSIEELFKAESNRPAGMPKKPLEFGGPTGKTPLIKTVDFFMGNSTTHTKENWRNACKSVMGAGESSIVNKNVLLIPDDMNLRLSGDISLEDMNENFGSAGGFIELLQSLTEILTHTKTVHEWKAKVFKDIGALTAGPSDFKFKFQFGNAGLNNSYEEVVKPILALTAFFGISTGQFDSNGNKDPKNGAAATISTPWPTKSEFLASHVKYAAQSLINDVTSAKKSNEPGVDGEQSPGAAQNLVETISRTNSKLQSLIAAGARKTALDASKNNLYVVWGRFTVGPMTYNKYEYSFDMSNLDDWGWPTSGYFQVSGLTSMRKATTQAMIAPFVQGI